MKSGSRLAKRLLRKLLKKQMRPRRVMITDKLASYGAAKRDVMPGIEHRQHKGLNNRAENSHQPTRRLVDGKRNLVVRARSREGPDSAQPRHSGEPYRTAEVHPSRPFAAVVVKGSFGSWREELGPTKSRLHDLNNWNHARCQTLPSRANGDQKASRSRFPRMRR